MQHGSSALDPCAVKCSEMYYLDCARAAELEVAEEHFRERNLQSQQIRSIWGPSAAFHTATGAARAAVATARVSKALVAVLGRPSWSRGSGPPPAFGSASPFLCIMQDEGFKGSASTETSLRRTYREPSGLISVLITPWEWAMCWAHGTARKCNSYCLSRMVKL